MFFSIFSVFFYLSIFTFYKDKTKTILKILTELIPLFLALPLSVLGQ